jgi:hypothetical protein
MHRALYIFYMHYEVTGTDNKNRPRWFDYESCFKTLLDTLPSDINLHLIMDGTIKNNWIHKYKDRYHLWEVNGGSMTGTAMEMYKIANSMDSSESDLFYFLENDYLHVDGWLQRVFHLYKVYGESLSYVSLYDHRDKYIHYPELASKIFCDDRIHWRTVPSTCGSFITTSKLFKEDYVDFTTVIGDHNKWLHLSETKGRFIITPIPGLSTHCMEGLLSPTINWEEV